MRDCIIVLISSALLASCGEDTVLPTYHLDGSAMGTTFSIGIIEPGPDLSLDALQANIVFQLDAIENIASTYREKSELSLFNANLSTDWIDVSSDFCQMLSAALAVSRETGGAFDITVGPLVNLWGFGPLPGVDQPPAADKLAAAMQYVGYEKLQTDCARPAARKASAQVYVDLSGWAKGYAVDAIAALLDVRGLQNYIVEIGGELRVHGHNGKNEKFAIAIEKPIDDDDMQYAVVDLTNASVATSGDYRNYFEYRGRRYSHTINPATGAPVTHNLAEVTVIGDSAAHADALATALLVLGPDDGPGLAEELGIAAYFVVREERKLVVKRSSEFDRTMLQ
jgi:thiamine biosynthesis lipoprotein